MLPPSHICTCCFLHLERPSSHSASVNSASAFLERKATHPAGLTGQSLPLCGRPAATAPGVTTITTHSHCDCPTLPVAPRADTVPGPPAHHPLPDPAPSHQGLPSTGLTPLTLVPTNAPKNSACQVPPHHGTLGSARDRTGPATVKGKPA